MREFTLVDRYGRFEGSTFLNRKPRDAAKKAVSRLADREGTPIDVRIYDVEKRTVRHYVGSMEPIERLSKFNERTGRLHRPVVYFVRDEGHPYLLQRHLDGRKQDDAPTSDGEEDEADGAEASDGFASGDDSFSSSSEDSVSIDERERPRRRV